jgi:replicative DNA helicase
LDIDFESALITSIIDEKNIRDVIKWKITADFFFQPTSRAAFTFLLGWYSNPQYGDTPSWESFSDTFQHFEPVRMEESIIALCDKLRNVKLYSDVATLLSKVGEAVSGDALEGLNVLKAQVVSLTAAHTIDNASDIKNRLDDIRTEYMSMKNSDTGLKGKPYPWEALNRATLGLQNQQIVFLYGRPKSYKTWLLLAIMKSLHESGSRILFFSQELSDIEIIRRFVALTTGVDYNLFQRGALPEQEEFDFLQNLDMFVEQESFIVDRLTVMGEGCLTEMSAKIQEYKPSVVGVDGVNYLSTDWKELAEITRGMKRHAQQYNIPIVGSTHANRSRGKKGEATDNADDFAYGDAFYQVADLALRASCEIENRKKREVQLFTSAIREGSSALFTVHTILAQDMTQKEVLKIGDSDTDVDEQIDQDMLDKESDMRTDETEAAQ